METIFYISPFSVKIQTIIILCLMFGLIVQSKQVHGKDIQLARTEKLLNLSLEDLFSVPITSASLFPETDLDTGSTVTVITSEYWQDRGAKRLDDAVSYMPGFTPLPHFLGVKKWAIRGFINSNGNGVQTLWDGVSINTFPVGMAQLDHSNIQLNTLDSIEVIRGPGSALYGADAFYGVVSLNAFESEQNLQQATLRAGSNGYYEGAFKTSTNVFNNWRLNFALSTNGQPDQNEEYQYLDSGTVKTGTRNYNFNSYSTSVKLASDPKRKTAYKFGVYYNDHKQENYFHNGTSVPSNDTADVNSNLGMVKGESKWRLNENSSLTLDASYWTESHDFHRILSAANNKINIIVDEERQATANLTYRNDHFMDNTELSMVLSYKGNEVKNAYRTITDADGNVTLEADLLFGDKKRNIASFLMDGKTHFLGGKYILRYGFRYDDYSDFGSYLTPRLGLIKLIDQTSSVKLLYGNAFRAPTGNELYGAPRITGNSNLKPEEIDTYELVYIKSQGQGQGKDKMKFEAVLFKSNVKNAIATIGNFPNASYENNSENSATGIELTYIKQFNKLLLDVNGSYVQSKNNTDNIDITVFPEFIVNLGLGYSFTSIWSMTLNNRIMRGVTKTPTTTTNTPDDLPDYWRVDLNNTIHYSENFDIFVNIRNLLDRDNYYPSTSDSPQRDNFVTGIQDEGITLDAGVRIQF